MFGEHITIHKNKAIIHTYCFSFGIDKEGRCLIADDMGLGKTFQALAIASYFKYDWPLLIVATSSMKYLIHYT